MPRVGFVELYKEEIRDLLCPEHHGPQDHRPPITIREVPGSGVCLAGATEVEAGPAQLLGRPVPALSNPFSPPQVFSRAEMAGCLERGSLARATSSTGMNKRSSRSHAIFTITVEQRRKGACAATAAVSPAGSGCAQQEQQEEEEEAPGSAAGTPTGSPDSEFADVRHPHPTRAASTACDDGWCAFGGGRSLPQDEYLCAKIHLVDLAGSERAKRTKAEGQRLQEGIHINKGLLGKQGHAAAAIWGRCSTAPPTLQLWAM